MSGRAAYYAVADSHFFLGVVALANSLRLTGNNGEIVVIDAGLFSDQRRFLERECTLVDPELGSGIHAAYAKPSINRLEPQDRTIILLDSDIIVTSCFDSIVARADAGSICGFVNNDTHRWFAEWREIFRLRAPLRHKEFLNSSFVALSLANWRVFLERWETLCLTIQEERSKRPFLLRRDEVLVDPIGFNEQDALNALLMSEVPDDAVSAQGHEFVPSWVDRKEVSVVDALKLRCDFAGQEPAYIEWTGTPKPWMPWGWMRRSYRAYACLFPRVVLGNDVPLRLSRSELPFWLRGTTPTRYAYGVLNGSAGVAQTALGVLPMSVRSRISHVLRTALSRRPSSS